MTKRTRVPVPSTAPSSEEDAKTERLAQLLLLELGNRIGDPTKQTRLLTLCAALIGRRSKGPVAGRPIRHVDDTGAVNCRSRVNPSPGGPMWMDVGGRLLAPRIDPIGADSQAFAQKLAEIAVSKL